MLEAAVYGSFTPCSMRKFVKSVHGAQQAENGEKIAYSTAAKMPRGHARARRTKSQMKDQSHPQFAMLSLKDSEEDYCKTRSARQERKRDCGM